jgi:tetratricopeptide (TPR) repeat protein
MKRIVLIVLVSLFSCSFDSGAAQEATVERAQTLLKNGAYKEAIAAFEALLQKSASDRQSQIGLIKALFETGDYSGAEKRAKQYLSNEPRDPSLRVWIGEIQLETGRYAEAVVEFEQAAREAKGAAWLQATLGRARSLRAQGKNEESLPLLEEVVQYYLRNSPRSAEELTMIGRALTYLEKFKDANDIYIDAREADPSQVEAYIGQGELMNEKYHYADAASLFQDALKINNNSPAAQTGSADSKRVESSAEAYAAVKRALTVNPNFVPALVLQSWLDLEAENRDDAMKGVERALSVNPNSVEALSVRAAMLYLGDQKSELDALIKRVMGINPKAGLLYSTLGHFAVINRRYADAVDFGRTAVDLSPKLWSARTELGIQLLRVGRIAEGRAELERAFAGDPYNVWAKNTLDLLDSMKDHRETIRGPFLIKSTPKETASLAVYAADLLEEAHKKLTTKYKFTPRAPIAVEVFPNHEDFAVRSLGLPGLGALGVCFGQVIAMDSPAARPAGEFNWGSTLWHEFAHVITLQITEHRIPRWFSEGLSVFEERRARPGWGANWSIGNLKAFKDGRFVNIEDLDAAFTRPRSADGVTLAYFQASIVCELIEEKHGFDAILKMLAAYKDGVKTPEVLHRVLSMSPSQFDKAFNEYVTAKTSKYAEAIGQGRAAMGPDQPLSKEGLAAIIKSRPNDYFANLGLGSLYKKEGDNQRAIEYLKRASELFPFYGAEGNPYWQLAEIYESTGQKTEAAAALESLTRYNETNAEAFSKLARLKLELGDRVGALEALQSSFYVYPFDVTLHKLAGDVYLDHGRALDAVREFRVVVALEPPDAAGAHYDLARSLEASGNRAEAKKEILKSLEIAPGFDKAQELLLKLRN